MKTITTPDGNLSEVFFHDKEYTVMYDRRLQQGSIMEDVDGDICVAYSYHANSVGEAVQIAAEHMLGDEA